MSTLEGSVFVCHAGGSTYYFQGQTSCYHLGHHMSSGIYLNSHPGGQGQLCELQRMRQLG